DQVVALVDGDAVEPGGQLRPATEAGERAVGGDERLLEDVLGVVAVPADAQRDRVDPVAVTGHDLVERRAVAAGRLFGELLVRGWAEHEASIARGRPIGATRSPRLWRCAPTSSTTRCRPSSWPRRPPSGATPRGSWCTAATAARSSTAASPT